MKKNWFTVTKINQKVFALAEFNHWEQVVSYLIIDKAQAFLIDTGMGYESIAEKVNNLTSLPVTVLLTHAHWDHIGGINEFKNVYIFNNPFEIESLKKGFSSNEIPELSEKKLFSNSFVPVTYMVEGKKSFKVFEDSQIITSDSIDIHVIHTPGHTPGSVCFYIPQLKVLVTGDTLYPGPLYAQLEESNIHDYWLSIKKLLKIANPDLLILPGHNSVGSNSKILKEADELFSFAVLNYKRINDTEVKGQYLSIKL